MFELQVGQKKHDEQFHRDIFFLSHQERFKHVAFHFGKYTARLARVFKTADQGKTIDKAAGQRTLADSILMILNAAEICKVDLAKALAPDLGTEADGTSLNKILQSISDDYASKYPWLESQDQRRFALGMLEMTDRAGILHKACDSLDHMEGLSRDTVTAAILDLFVIVVLVGKVTGIDYESNIPMRWQEIERSKVL